jgi:acyl carrier protein
MKEMKNTDPKNILDELRVFVVNRYLLGAKDAKLSDDTSFLEEGIIDSIGVIELTNHIQKVYGIKIKVTDIVPANFDTLNNIERYITRKLKK